MYNINTTQFTRFNLDIIQAQLNSGKSYFNT